MVKVIDMSVLQLTVQLYYIATTAVLRRTLTRPGTPPGLRIVVAARVRESTRVRRAHASCKLFIFVVDEDDMMMNVLICRHMYMFVLLS